MEFQISSSASRRINSEPRSAGSDSERVNSASLQGLQSAYLSPGARREFPEVNVQKTLGEKLFDARASCKIATANVAMHLEPEWRKRFFVQLDSLMDVENWEEEDAPVNGNSFNTLLRILLYIKPERRPGLGATASGNIIASWSTGKDNLTIECGQDDQVSWVLSVRSDDSVERAAGKTKVSRLISVLSPYIPGRWFNK